MRPIWYPNMAPSSVSAGSKEQMPLCAWTKRGAKARKSPVEKRGINPSLRMMLMKRYAKEVQLSTERRSKNTKRGIQPARKKGNDQEDQTCTLKVGPTKRDGSHLRSLWALVIYIGIWVSLSLSANFGRNQEATILNTPIWVWVKIKPPEKPQVLGRSIYQGKLFLGTHRMCTNFPHRPKPNPEAKLQQHSAEDHLRSLTAHLWIRVRSLFARFL